MYMWSVHVHWNVGFHSENRGYTCNPPVDFPFIFRPAGWSTDLYVNANSVWLDGTERINSCYLEWKVWSLGYTYSKGNCCVGELSATVIFLEILALV